MKKVILLPLLSFIIVQHPVEAMGNKITGIDLSVKNGKVRPQIGGQDIDLSDIPDNSCIRVPQGTGYAEIRTGRCAGIRDGQEIAEEQDRLRKLLEERQRKEAIAKATLEAKELAEELARRRPVPSLVNKSRRNNARTAYAASSYDHDEAQSSAQAQPYGPTVLSIDLSINGVRPTNEEADKYLEELGFTVERDANGSCLYGKPRSSYSTDAIPEEGSARAQEIAERQAQLAKFLKKRQR